MKTKLHLLLLFLFPSFLSAQIYVKLNLDDTGLYTVVVKTERAILDPIVGSGQITITAPFGGFKIGEITSINGEWNKSPDIINQSVASAIEHDYFFIGLRDGDGFNSMSICEEQTLFTFRNIGVHTGRAALITKEDPMVTKEIDLNNNPYHDLSIFDSSTGNLHNIGGTYNTVTPPQYMELTESICKGDSFLFNGAELMKAGIYRDTIQYDNGCYGYRVLNLAVNTNGNISQTLVLQPNAEDGKDAFLLKNLNGDTTNRGANYRMMITAGTNGGVPNYGRSLIDFDFTAIPSNAIIDKAELTLYYEPITPGNNFVHRGDAAFYLQRITSNWEEHSVTWANQPSYSEKNKIAQPTLTGKQSLGDLDVTSLVKDMIAEPENSFGLLFRLQTEERYRTLQLASSDIDDPSLHPKLEITYTVPNETISTMCDSINTEIPIDTIVQPSIEITDIKKITVASAVIKWRSTQVAISYELQVRIKDTSSIWETAERLNTNVSKAYFYGPMNKIFEFRVIAYYENGEQVISDIVEHSTFRED